MAYNTENTFVALIDQNGMIRDMSTGRRGEVIGVDYQKEDEYKRTISEMQEPLDSYYNKLVEIRKYLIDRYDDKDMVNQLSAFAPPVTAEMIAQEAAAEQLRLAQEQATQQAELNKVFMESLQASNQMLASLQSEIKELKSNGNSGSGFESGTKQIGGDSQSDRPTGKSSKGGSTAGAKDAT